jgi:hypothetical protein
MSVVVSERACSGLGAGRWKVMRYAISFLILLAPLARPQTGRHPAPASPKDFAVMAWGGSPSDSDQLRGMRDAGLNISGFCRAQDLERVQAAGLTCFVSDAGIQRMDPLRLPSEEQMRSAVSELKKQMGASPAALGFYLRDEPSAELMPGLGKLTAVLREAMPDKWPYVNLFPYRVPAARL